MKQNKEKCYSSLMTSKQLVLADAKPVRPVPDWDGMQWWGLPRGPGHTREATARSEMETKCQVPICTPDGEKRTLVLF